MHEKCFPLSFLYFLLHGLLLFLTLFLFSLQFFNLNYAESMYFISSASLVFVFISLALLLISADGIVSFAFIFSVIYIAYLMTPLMFYSTFDSSFSGFINNFDRETVVSSWKIILYFYYWFIFSATYIQKRLKRKYDLTITQKPNPIFKNFIFITLFLVILTSIPQYFIFSGYAWFAIKNGYSALVNALYLFSIYDQTLFDSILFRIADLHVPLVLILWFISLKNNNRLLQKFSVLLLILSSSLSMFAGYRAKAFIPIISIFVIFQSVRKPISYKQWILLGFVLVISGSFLQSFRLQTGGFLTKIESTESLTMDKIYQTLTFQEANEALFITLSKIPNQRSYWGISQLVTHSLKGLPLVGSKFESSETPGEWYNETVFSKEFSKGYGKGYSIVAESIAYFACFFPLFAIFLGLIVGSVEFIFSSSRLYFCLTYIPLLHPLLFSPRNTLLNVFTSFFSISLPIVLFFFVSIFMIKTATPRTIKSL